MDSDGNEAKTVTLPSAATSAAGPAATQPCPPWGREDHRETIVEMIESATPEMPLFRADRPFLYVIRENSTGAMLFMGIVGKPEYEE